MQNAEPIERFDEFVCIGRDVDPEIVAAEVHLKGRESTLQSCLTGPRPRCEVRFSRFDLTASGAPLYPARYTFASLPALIRPTTSVASPADRIASTTDR